MSIGQGARVGTNDWPEGCVGYAFNLVRPAMKGHRASLLYPMLGQTLVSHRDLALHSLKEMNLYLGLLHIPSLASLRLGMMQVFETLPQANAYRQFCTQV